MTRDPSAFTYDVALSFAGAERQFVQEVANGLKLAAVRIFYDEDQTANVWGENLVELLDKVYREESRYAVMFVSRAYSENMWTKHERRSLQARALREKSAYILPVRIDDTELDGLLPSIAYLDAARFGSVGIVEQVLRKLGHHTTPTPLWSSGVPSSPDALQRLVTQRPPGWEYLLYAGSLIRARDRVEDKCRDHAIGYVRSTGIHLDSYADANVAIKQAMDRGQHLVQQFMRVLDPQVQEGAFGPPGYPGNPEMIMHIAKRFGDVYEGFIDTAAQLRGTAMPDEYSRLRDIVSRFYDQPIWRMRSFVDEFAWSVHDLPQRIERGDPGIAIRMEVTLEIPDELDKAATKEFKRLQRRIR
ncbi:TIR domain-containing protein [Kribbella sp. NPDC056345]|uniref:TIR domain-containing protein n=1 Tax=Kribbella sp. NPDC056345 TaxID=3345789 RepID=UPI0035DAF711